MKFTFAHNNINVFDPDKSIAFYKKALGLTEDKRFESPDKSFLLVYMKASKDSPHSLELTWLRDRKEKYDLGDNEIHMAYKTDDFDAAYALHAEMGCICYENKEMGLYFIEDPDGYWTEIIRQK